MDAQVSAQGAESRLRLGTFVGVFTPTILTILGVMMYLRLGWVVGNAGLWGAIAIVGFANAITFLTSVSLSTLATNMKVGVGGAYFLISRTLGLELGGAIGIPLFLCQALSVTLYCYGLAEVLLSPWPGAPVPVLTALIVVGVGALAARSTELTLKLQLPIMALIFLSIFSLSMGADWGGPKGEPFGPWTDTGFWGVFAVFFPAVTGILAGVSLSGDLADPGRSIPRGVLAAVALGFVVYMVIPIALAGSLDAAALRDLDKPVWPQVAWAAWLVFPGMIGAILSSAFGSVLGAPRTLQALAYDGLAPEQLAEIDSETGEPTWALRLTVAIALGAVLLGNLNAVATVLTMFFLTTYGTLNFVAAIEVVVGDPSFRPRIRIPWWMSALGGLGCVVAMFAISPAACVFAIVVEVALFWWLRRRSMQATFGDVRGGMLLSGARFALLGLRDAKAEPRSWRPHILVFTTDPHETFETIKLADAFSQHRGIVTVTRLVVGDVEGDRDLSGEARANDAMLESRGVTAFCEVIAVPDLLSGVMVISQANGFAGLDSNTMMFAYAEEEAVGLGRLLRLSRKLAVLEKCTLIHHQGIEPAHDARDLVVWWKGLEHNGDLMLLLAHLASGSPAYRGAHIVLKSVVDTEEEARRRRAEFAAMLPAIRIEARVDVIVRPPERPISEMIREHSQGARLVFLGMSTAGPGDETAYAEQLLKMLVGLPDTVLVRNAGPFRGRLVQ